MLQVRMPVLQKARKIRFLPENEISDHIERDIEEDIAPLTRQQIIKKHTEELSTDELYRMKEFESIIDQLKISSNWTLNSSMQKPF